MLEIYMFAFFVLPIFNFSDANTAWTLIYVGKLHRAKPTWAEKWKIYSELH